LTGDGEGIQLAESHRSNQRKCSTAAGRKIHSGEADIGCMASFSAGKPDNKEMLMAVRYFPNNEQV
jgi:hypothetical protein